MYVLNVVKHIPCLCVVVCVGGCVQRERESLDYCFNENSDQIRNLPEEYSSLSFSLQYLAVIACACLAHFFQLLCCHKNYLLLLLQKPLEESMSLVHLVCLFFSFLC